MNGNQVLGYLSRSDKWYLGGGKAVIWAPEFPLFLDKPGFWDHACYLDYRVGPVFTLAFLDNRGHEIEPLLLERFWQPDHAAQLYRDKSRDLVISERRALLPWDVLVSSFEFSNSLNIEQTIDVILWTAQDREANSAVVSEIENFRVRERDGIILMQRRIREAETAQSNNPDEGVLMRFNIALGANRGASSYCIKTSNRQPNYPRYKYTPFYEKMIQYSSLHNEAPAEHNPAQPTGLLYFGQQYRLIIPAKGKTTFSAFAAIAASAETALAGLVSARRPLKFSTPSKEVTPSGQDKTAGTLERERRPTVPAKRLWTEYFQGVPDFSCSDPYIQKYYWYRWYGLRLNTIRVQDDRLGLNHPCIFEGVNLGWFRQHISYSAQCHMLETRWMHDPSLAQGSILNFVQNQLENGSFPGVIKNIYQGDRKLTSNVAFYHANWGWTVRELHRIHPYTNFLQKVYEPLCRYLLYFDKERDADQTGLYDVINHWETGQEFMSRYQAVDPKSDLGGSLRLKGLDATVYIYELQRNLAWMAEQLHKWDEAGRWQAMASRTRQALLTKMWNPSDQFFYDVNPSDLTRIEAKSAIGFYPFMSDLATTEHLGAFSKHLFNSDEFWTPYPVPSTSKSDSTFSAEGEWNGERLVCPWNGRTWLMTNSHVSEALCRASLELDPSLQPKAADLVRRFIKMLYLDGNLERPSSYEYYNPFTGQAPYFRGTDDYMHSWIVDLIVKYVAGVQPQDGGQVLIRPLPFDLDYFTLDKLKIANHWLKVTWRKNQNPVPKWSSSTDSAGAAEPDTAPQGLAVFVDGQLVAQRQDLGQLGVKL
jgi:hypothetical protein